MPSNINGMRGNLLSPRSEYVSLEPIGIDVPYRYEAPTAPKINIPSPAKATVKSRGISQPSMSKADVANSLSRGTGVEIPSAPASNPTRDPAVETVAEVLKKQYAKDEAKESIYNKGQMALAGIGFLLDVSNAMNSYETTKGQAQLNILQARNQAADALYRGRQAQMSAQSQGYQAGQDALLNAAAQGQDVSGAAVNKIQGSYEAIGIYNGMMEEVNSMREAMGYELQETAYKYQIKNAATARNNAIIGSALSNGAKIATYGAM